MQHKPNLTHVKTIAGFVTHKYFNFYVQSADFVSLPANKYVISLCEGSLISMVGSSEQWETEQA